MIGSAYVGDADGWMFLANGPLSVGIAVPNESPLLAELWSLVEASSDAGIVLDALTRTGISSAPHFVIVTLGAGGKVLVRGQAALTVEGSESGTVTGSGFSSWAERSFERIDRFECEIIPSRGAVRLPMYSGAIRAGWFAADTNGVAWFGNVFPPATAQPLGPEPITQPADPECAEQTVAPTVPPASGKRVTQESKSPESLAEATVVAPVDEDDEMVEEAVGSAPSAAPSAYDFLFGETAYRTVEDAAVRSTGEADDAASRGVEDRTVVASDLAKLRAQRRAGRGRPLATPASKAKFYVELSTGGRELLDQPLVIGRAPSASALGGGVIPRLITMTTINQDISRTHAQIAVEGETVVVTDLHSRNGTLVTMPGRPAQKLREGEPTVVIPGTIVDLGDGATVTIQEG